MKKIKIYTGAITLVIVGLMIAVSASAMVQIPEEENTFKLKKVEKAIVGMDIVKAKTLETQLKYPSAAPIDAILVVDGHHPAVASDSAYAVLGFEDIDYENVWFTASPDAGQTWIDNAAGWIIPEPPELPDADSCGDGRFLGGMVPNYLDFEGGAMYKVKIADPLDIPGGYTCSYWTFNELADGYFNFDAIGVGAYTAEDPAENEWAFGGHSIIGDHGGDSGVDTPFFSYQMTPDGYAWIFRWTGVNGCTSTSHDIDSDTLYSYAVWNWANPENGGLLDIFFYHSDWGVWETEQGYPIHPDFGAWTMSTEGNDEYVDVSAYMDNVIIVSQNGDDIVAYYSHNAMVDISETTIATGGYVNPRIVHIDELTATCLVIKEEVVYFSTTEDGGVTWSPMEAVEDSDYVPTEYKRADVCGFGAAYESEDEIYFAPLWGEPGAILEIMSISGGIGVSAVIKNTGGTDATNVEWNITVTGGLFGLINKETTDTITTLAVDAEETVTSGLILGLGPIAITVTATADGAMPGDESADAKVLFFIVTPKDIFP